MKRHKQKKPRFLLLTCTALIALIGTFLLLVIHAASSTGSVEPENGTLAGQASIVNDSNASGGKAVAFAPATTSGCGSDSGFTPVGMRTIPCTLYGVTSDDTTNMNQIIASSKAFVHKPTTRWVIDKRDTPGNFTNIINQLQPDSFIMAELIDSYQEKNIAPGATENNRVSGFVNAFGNKVDIWEVGNEVNGNWTGNYADMGTKITDRYNIVHNAGKRTALTLWENTFAPNHCGNGNNELTPQQFSSQHLPASVRNGLNYVLLSWYPTECGGLANNNVPVTSIKDEITALHALYPNALIGFGELGYPYDMNDPQNPIGKDATIKLERGLVDYYYGLSPQINLPYYVGGYFYWYYYEDALPYTTGPLWPNLNAGFGKY